MINETYKSMLSGKSVIRELNEYANDFTRHPHLKPEDIFDYSLGNPSVPVPEAFNARIKALLDSAATFSVICSARLAPMSAEVTALSRSAHCSANWESVSPRASAILVSASIAACSPGVSISAFR